MRTKNTLDRDSLVKENLGLVYSCANRFKNRYIEYDDLFQAGCMGLVKAIDNFDTTRGVMLSTYAVPVILGEMKRLFRDGGTVKVSRTLKELSLKMNRIRERFVIKNNREPTISELAEILEVSEEDIIDASNVNIPPISLTMTDDENGGLEFDIESGDNYEELCEIISLKEIINTLDNEDRNLIILRFYKNKTQSEVAKILATTQVQISRREKKILEKLRRHLE